VKPAAVVAAGRLPATGLISTRVAALMKGVLRTMLATKFKTLAAAAIGLTVIGLGVGVMFTGGLTAQQADQRQPGRAAAEAAPGGGPSRSTEKRPATPGQAGSDDGEHLPRAQAQSRSNLKQIAQAMRNCQDVQRRLPAPAIYAGDFHDGVLKPSPTADELGEGPGGASAAAPGARGGPPVRARKQGAALLSWRVALLPYLDEMELFKQFKLDESWDSPHNKKLLNKMPHVYAPPGVTTREPYTTFYQVFVGPHAAFEKHRAMRLPTDLLDGTSNVLLVVEAAAAVPWTKPEDLHFAEDEPVPGLGGLYPGLFNAAFADGSVLALSTNIDAKTLRYAIMRDDGHALDLEPWKLPVSRRGDQLKRENQRLQKAVDVERRRLQELRRQKKELEESHDAERLRKENARLE
jgi:hypothetical protein